MKNPHHTAAVRYKQLDTFCHLSHVITSNAPGFKAKAYSWPHSKASDLYFVSNCFESRLGQLPLLDKNFPDFHQILSAIPDSIFDNIIIASLQILSKQLFTNCVNVRLNTAQKGTASLNKFSTDHSLHITLTNCLYC